LVFGDLLAPTANTQIALDRSILLRPDVPSGDKAGLTVKASVMPTIEPIRPPTGAPNIVMVLLDAWGFGTAGTVGKPVARLELDAVTAEGLRYNRS
jgi:arylsulfatase